MSGVRVISEAASSSMSLGEVPIPFNVSIRIATRSPPGLHKLQREGLRYSDRSTMTQNAVMNKVTTRAARSALARVRSLVLPMVWKEEVMTVWMPSTTSKGTIKCRVVVVTY
jgi:hypothetical protein